MTETKLTQAQAARAAGVSRTSIWRAIRQGRLSAEQAGDGGVCIDASELLRVFPRARLERARERSPDGAVNAHERSDETDRAGEVGALRTLVDELQADKRHLRVELERAAEERTRLLTTIERKDELLAQQAEHVRLLTDQRPRPRGWFARWWRREARTPGS